MIRPATGPSLWPAAPRAASNPCAPPDRITQAVSERWESINEKLRSVETAHRASSRKYCALALLGVGAGVALAWAVPALASTALVLGALGGGAAALFALGCRSVANEAVDYQQMARSRVESLNSLIRMIEQEQDAARRVELEAMAARFAAPGGAVGLGQETVSVGAVRLPRRGG